MPTGLLLRFEPELRRSGSHRPEGQALLRDVQPAEGRDDLAGASRHCGVQAATRPRLRVEGGDDLEAGDSYSRLECGQADCLDVSAQC